MMRPNQAQQVAEKVIHSVILSEARNLSWIQVEESKRQRDS